VSRPVICSIVPSAFCRPPVVGGLWLEVHGPDINLSRYEEIVPNDGVYVTRTRVARNVLIRSPTWVTGLPSGLSCRH